MRVPFPTHRLLFALLAAAISGANSPAQDLAAFEKGKVIPRVTSLSDSGHTYALYLPSGYTPSRQWPVLFAFDPGARGHAPVERFQEAAEKYGYIVMGSNNSRNGPVKVEFEAMRALYTDARRRFSVDENRLYSAGFSGAARVATRIGLMLKGLAGAIIVGGGFPGGAKPSLEIRFALYGIAGETDLNFNEMLRLHSEFTRLGIANRFVVLPGGHEWPSSAVLREAFEWMELEAMRKGTRSRDPELMTALLAARLERAKALEEKGDIAAAFRRFEEISKDFRDLADLNEVEADVARLKALPELARALKDAEKREKRMEQRDDEQSARLMDAIHAIFATGGMRYMDGRVELTPEKALSSGDMSLQGEEIPRQMRLRSLAAEGLMLPEITVARLGIANLHTTIQKKPGTDEAILAERQRSRIFISSFESARMLVDMKKYAQAVQCLEITAQAAPDNAFVDFNLARAQALNQRRSEALKSLASAAAKGFDRPEMIEKDEAFDSLRGTPEYAAALEKIRARAGGGL